MRIRASQMSASVDDMAWYIVSGSNNFQTIHKMKQKVQFLSTELEWTGNSDTHFPVSCYFDPIKGKCSFDAQLDKIQDPQAAEVPPTVPFEIQVPPEQAETDVPQVPDAEHSKCATSSEDLQFHEVASDFHGSPQSIHAATVDTIAVSRDSDTPVSEHLFKILDDHEILVHLIPGTYGKLQVSHQVCLADVLELWNFSVFPVSLMDSPGFSQESVDVAMTLPTDLALLAPIHLFDPQSQIVFNCDGKPVILVDHAYGTKAFALPHQSWEWLVAHLPNLTHMVTDVGTAIPDQVKITTSIRVLADVQPAQPFFDIHAIAVAMQEVHLLASIPIDTDILVIKFEATEPHLTAVLTFWHVALDAHWLCQHGRQMRFQALTGTQAQLIFRPNGSKFATPISLFRDSIMHRLFQCGLASLDRMQGDVLIQFQESHYRFDAIRVPGNMDLTCVKTVLRHAFALDFFGKQPQIICGGKQQGDIVQFHELPKVYNMDLVRCHIVMPLAGGGGSKQDHKQVVDLELANLLMEHGLTLADVPDTIKLLVKTYGLPKITNILFGAATPDKSTQLIDMCKQVGIDLSNAEKMPSARKKYQKLENKKDAALRQNIDPMQYQLQPGFFVIESKEPLQVHQRFNPCTPGISMVTPTQAMPYLTAKHELRTEEKAILVVGTLPQEAMTFPKVTVPATNSQGSPCLIAGYLINLGSKKVHMATDAEAAIQTVDTQVCSFTMWKEEFTAQEWDKVTASPVRHANQILLEDGWKQVIHSPHGRAFRAGNKQSKPQDATSVQFHGQIRLVDLRMILKRSGFNRLYILPKNDTGRADERWRVLWSHLTPTQMEQATIQLPFVSGLVKNPKPDKLNATPWGLRVEAKHFDEVWSKLYPGSEPPTQAPKGSTWKIYPLPDGVDRQVLADWAQLQGWQLYPLRPFGPKAWLIRAAEGPPKTLLTFNSTPLIVTKLQDRNAPPEVGLVAGPKSHFPRPALPSQETNIFRMGDPHHDPWKPAQVSTAASSAQAPAPRGSTHLHLAQHDQQLAALEKAVEKLQLGQQGHAEAVQSQLKEVSTNLEVSNQEDRTAIQGLRNDFQTTLQQAMVQQDNRLGESLAEIKQVFLRAEKRKVPPAEAEDDEFCQF